MNKPDPIAIEIDKNYPKFYACALNILKDRQLAEDAIHDAYVSLYIKGDDYTEKSVFSLIYTAVKNRSLTMLRGINRWKPQTYVPGTEELLAENLPDDSQSPLDKYNEKSVFTDVLSCINKLPSHYKYILIQFYINRVPIATIAKETDTPINTIKTRIYRARTKLQTALRKRGYE